MQKFNLIIKYRKPNLNVITLNWMETILSTKSKTK
jgi:hypothetical protein